ncbi:MAG: bis(5'-nucleosyl)-tetraphosphatase (symmetrical) YqeK [Culicoidibacterales bacterium]
MIEQIKNYNSFHVTKKRNEHIARVVEMAHTLAEIYQLSEKEHNQLITSAWLHDSTKDFSDSQLESIIEKENSDLLKFPKPIWHSFASAILGRDFFRIEDTDVFDAVFYHTIGNESLNIVGQLLFLADYIEVGRTFPCANEARDIALSGELNQALYTTLKNTITYLKQEGKQVSAETEAFYAKIERSI